MSAHDTNPFEEATRPPPPPYRAPAGGPNAGPATTSGYSHAPPPPNYQPPQPDPHPQFYQPSGNQGYATNVAYNPPPPGSAYSAPAPTYGSSTTSYPHPTNGQYDYRNEAQPQYPPAAAPQQQPQQPQVQQPQAQTQQALPPARELQNQKFWQLSFYQQFFDVDTVDVLKRMGNTLVPISPPDFLIFRHWHLNQPTVPVETSIESGGVVERQPDLYGPFWVCTTLWMTLAIVGNMMSKISHSRALASGVAGTSPTWTYDFTVASVAIAVIYLYCGGMSLLLWGIMYWKHVPVTLVDTVALYGYSMFIFLLAAILCAIPISLLQWLVVIICGLWSTAYLLLNLWQVWKLRLRGIWFTGVVLLVSIMHIGVTASFKFYFLNYSL